MGSFWFVSAPLFGHLDWGGYLKTALALQATGHSVTWISQPSIGGYVARQGIPFAPVTHTGWLWPPPPAPNFAAMSPGEATFIRHQRALNTWLSEDLIPPAVEAILDLAEKTGSPDVIATDPFLSASAIAAEKLGVPLIVCGWPAVQAPDEHRLIPAQRELAQAARERIAGLCQRFGIQGENFAQGPTPSVQSPHLHISYFSYDWHAGETELLPQTHFVGGQATPPLTPLPDWLADLPAQPVAMITLGSVFTGDLGFFARSAQAVHRLGWIPIVVIGRNPISSDDKARLKAALPPGTRLLSWVDYNHVLPRLQAIVHHGGMGTTHAAIVHGVPQIVVPHAADQRGQARRVTRAGIGMHLNAQDIRDGQLETSLHSLGTNDQIRVRCQHMANAFQELGGPTQAARLLAGVQL